MLAQLIAAVSAPPPTRWRGVSVPAASGADRRRRLHWRAIAALGGLLATLALWPIAVQARDMTGKGGVGTLIPTNTVLGSTPVITLRYWRRALAVELHTGFDWLRASNGLDDVRRIHFGGGVTWALVDGPRLSAGVGVRSWARFGSRETRVSTSAEPRVASELMVLTEALLVAEWFISDHVGVSAAVGPSIFLASSFEASASADAGLKGLLGNNLARGGALISLGGHYGGGIGLLYYF